MRFTSTRLPNEVVFQKFNPDRRSSSDDPERGLSLGAAGFTALLQIVARPGAENNSFWLRELLGRSEALPLVLLVRSSL
jgi:hypothetical protein